MAHIPDGVLSAPVLVTGALASAGLVGYALRRLDYAALPQAAVLAAAFFVSSLISIPLGPSSAHLLLNGLMGLLLGWTAVPAVFVALLLQAAFFGHGGIIVLGVNTLNIALPALVSAFALRPLLAGASPRRAVAIGATAGALGVMLTALLVALCLALSWQPFIPAAKAVLLIYLPFALLEGLVTAVVVRFLLRVAPELLPGGGAVHA